MPKKLHLSIGDRQFAAEVQRSSVQVDDTTVAVDTDGNRLRAIVGADVFEGRASAAGDVVWVAIAGEVFPVHVSRSSQAGVRTSTDQAAFTAPMSATVVRIAVAPGDSVRDGDVLISLEAMKMELPIRAPRDGVVRAIHCQEGDIVQPDQVLLDFE